MSVELADQQDGELQAVVELKLADGWHVQSQSAARSKPVCDASFERSEDWEFEHARLSVGRRDCTVISGTASVRVERHGAGFLLY